MYFPCSCSLKAYVLYYCLVHITLGLLFPSQTFCLALWSPNFVAYTLATWNCSPSSAAYTFATWNCIFLSAVWCDNWSKLFATQPSNLSKECFHFLHPCHHFCCIILHSFLLPKLCSVFQYSIPTFCQGSIRVANYLKGRKKVILPGIPSSYSSCYIRVKIG